MIALDSLDIQILRELQADARLTNNELSDRIGLSPSQCSRRRGRLEQTETISGYHARLNKEAAGIGLISMISITLSSHSADNASQFKQLIDDQPSVLEAHALTGEMDYQLKVIAADLKSLSEFINNRLLSNASIHQVKTAIVLDTLKDTSSIPLTTRHSE